MDIDFEHYRGRLKKKREINKFMDQTKERKRRLSNNQNLLSF